MATHKKELTAEQKELIEKSIAHRKEKVEEIAGAALAMSLTLNLPVFDLPYYVLARVKSIIDEAFASVEFDSPKLRALRKEFLKQCLIEMNAKIVVPPKKEVKDATDERDNRCEPIAQSVANMLLDPNLVFSDELYFDEVLKDEENVPLFSSVFGYATALDEKMTMIIGEHWSRAQKKLFGVEREDVTFSQLDAILKQK